MKKRITILLGILVTALAVWYLLSKVNFEELKKVHFEIQPVWLLLFLFVLFAEFALIALRWSAFTGRMNYWNSLKSVFIAYGGNVILPARGGDLLRIIYIKKHGMGEYSRTFYALLLEKTFDLGVLATIFTASALLVFNMNPGVLVLPFMFLGIALTLVYLLNFQRSILLSILRFVFQYLPFKNKTSALLHHLEHLETSLSISDFVVSTVTSIILWVVLYPLHSYCMVSFFDRAVDIKYYYLLTSLSAVGYAMPSAPSALGVFHAAVVSALTAGKMSYEEALVIATVTHLAVSIPPLVAGGITFFTDPARKNKTSVTHS